MQDEAGWVGLGWTLNAGGVITRTVRGKADEVFGYLYNSSKVPTEVSINYGFSSQNKKEKTYSFIKRNADGRTDFEPDLFNFNFGNYSGTFYISQQGIPELFPPQDLNIQFVKGANSIDYFVIRDNSGLIYFFGRFGSDSTKVAIEESVPVFSSGDGQPGYRSAWYLVKVFDPLTGNEVNFEYTKHSKVTEGQTFINSITYTSSETWKKTTGSWDIDSPEEINTLTLYTDVLYLNKITWNNEILDFYISTTIQGGTLKLDSIVHHNTIDEKKNTYLFSYKGYNSNNNNEFRLKLASFVFKDPATANDKKYLFGYVNQTLPPKDSHAIDHWGFYNGGGDNQTLLPSTKFDTEIGRENFGDRTSNHLYGGADMLDTIVYPTGGTTTFEFESNKYKRKATREEKPHFTVYTDKVISHSMGEVDSLNLDSYFDNDSVEYYNFSLSAYLNGEFNNDDPLNGTVKLIQNGTEIYNIFLDKQTQNTTIDIGELDVKNNSYLLIAYIESGGFNGGDSIYGYMEYTYYDPNSPPDSVMQDAGGQRIKKITNYDPVTNTTTFKEYDYMQSGYLTSSEIPQYANMMNIKCSGTGCEDKDDALIINITSSNHRGLGTVAYKHVREYSGTIENNIGYTDTYFKTVMDERVGGSPYPPVLNRSWERNLKTKELIFSNLIYPDTGYELIRETRFDYKLDTAKSSFVRGFKSARTMSIVLKEGGDPYYDAKNQFEYTDYTLEVNKFNFTQQTTTDYTPSGKLVKTIKYKYDNPFQSDPTSIETTNSDGKTVKTVFKYPSDYVLDCYQPCLSNYKSNVTLCNESFDKCFDQENNCNSDWSNCYGQYLRCKMDEQDWYTNHCFPKGPLCKNFKCEETFTNCLNDIDYYNCLDNDTCSDSKCYDTAFVAYQECKYNIYDCAYNKYETATDPFLKAVYLMYLANAINKPVEKIRYVDNELVEKVRWDYKIFDDNDSVPFLYSVYSKYNSSDSLLNEITYEKYKNKLPAQVNIKDSYQRNVYLWSPSSKKLVAFIKNAQTDQVFYESFEENPDGAKFIKDGINMAKTGTKVKPGNTYSFPNDTITPSPDLLMSYWYYDGEKWNFKEEPFSSQISAGGNCQYIDEIRVYPKGAEMTTYSYDGLGYLINSTDQNGLSTTYEYDETGRLSTVRDHNKNIVKHFEYNYGHE